MSATAETIQSKPASEPRSAWALWLGQITTIMRLDVKRNFFGKRAVLIYLLALMPIGLLSLMAILPPGFAWADFTQYPLRFSLIYNALILRTVIFFGCAWIFMNLFRGEIVDRSLHYYFLSAVRREVLIAGKYFSGLVTSVVLFTTVTVVSMFLTFFRNPIIPALVLYGWEWINFLLPPLLKKISVIHYLNSLVPVPLSEGPFAVVASPTPAWISIPGLVIVTVLVLIVASRRIRRMEIRYGTD